MDGWMDVWRKPQPSTTGCIILWGGAVFQRLVRVGAKLNGAEHTVGTVHTSPPTTTQRPEHVRTLTVSIQPVRAGEERQNTAKDGSPCVCRPQLPYLLLNATGADPKPRMYPVFFGESIKVKPTPEREIK